MIFIYDQDTGKITQTMDFAGPERSEQLRQQGLGVIEFGNDPMQNFVDLTNKDDPVLRRRPQLASKPSKTEVAILEQTVIPSVPACSLEVTGPVSGTIAHPGGDLTIHFAIPGSYTVRCEAFPYLYVEWVIVAHTTSAAAQTGAPETFKA